MNEVERLTTALATMTEEREDAVDSHLNMCALHAQAKAEVERLTADLASVRAERDGLAKALASGVDEMCEGWCSDGGRGQFEDCSGCWLAARAALAALPKEDDR